MRRNALFFQSFCRFHILCVLPLSLTSCCFYSPLLPPSLSTSPLPFAPVLSFYIPRSTLLPPSLRLPLWSGGDQLLSLKALLRSGRIDFGIPLSFPLSLLFAPFPPALVFVFFFSLTHTL